METTEGYLCLFDTGIRTDAPRLVPSNKNLHVRVRNIRRYRTVPVCTLRLGLRSFRPDVQREEKNIISISSTFHHFLWICAFRRQWIIIEVLARSGIMLFTAMKAFQICRQIQRGFCHPLKEIRIPKPIQHERNPRVGFSLLVPSARFALLPCFAERFNECLTTPLMILK